MRFVLHILMAIVLGGALVLLFGTVVQYLWNAILPSVLGVGHLRFWQAIGVLLLARILVGGFHRGCHGHKRWGHRRSSWQQYEEWWREVGQDSYREYSAARPGSAPAAGRPEEK
jgi:heme A synthase